MSSRRVARHVSFVVVDVTRLSIFSKRHFILVLVVRHQCDKIGAGKEGERQRILKNARLSDDACVSAARDERTNGRTDERKDDGRRLLECE